ncbi:MAG: helix-turn-helix domain-containing protein [Moraxellaceae bacterium]|nr:helix-turn-helix domain-containing protein [Moraxellaceae bacterium]MDZ4386087.1 helix-turn-helix domain-containing protein [Moraxellaceae bacterium]
MNQQTAQSLGQLLSQARLDSGKSLKELHEATLVSVKYLTALEQNAFDELPSAAYIKGYLRRIAEVLGTSAEPLIAAYDARLNPVTPTVKAAATVAVASEPPCEAHSSDRSYFVDLIRLTQHLLGYLWSDIFPWVRDRLPAKRLLLILLILLVAVLGYRFWPTTQGSSSAAIFVPVVNVVEQEAEPVVIEMITPEPTPEVTAEATPEVVIPALDSVIEEPLVVSPPAPTPTPEPVTGPDRIEMSFFGPSVIRVTDANGKPGVCQQRCRVH